MLASSCGNSPLSKLLPKGTGMNKNMVTRNVHPVTTPNDSGLKEYGNFISNNQMLC